MTDIFDEMSAERLDILKTIVIKDIATMINQYVDLDYFSVLTEVILKNICVPAFNELEKDVAIDLFHKAKACIIESYQELLLKYEYPLSSNLYADIKILADYARSIELSFIIDAKLRALYESKSLLQSIFSIFTRKTVNFDKKSRFIIVCILESALHRSSTGNIILPSDANKLAYFCEDYCAYDRGEGSESSCSCDDTSSYDSSSDGCRCDDSSSSSSY